jgi:hypothetical protein
MKTIKSKHGYEILVDDGIFELVGHLKWTVRKSFDSKLIAVRAKIPNSDCIYMHHYVLGRKPNENESTFFKDGNKLNCQKENLYFKNHDRKKKGKFVGIKKVVMYKAQVRTGGKVVFIGLFKNETIAAQKRDEYVNKHNLRTKLNFLENTGGEGFKTCT